MSIQLAPFLVFGLMCVLIVHPLMAQYTPAPWPGTGANASLPWVPLRDSNGLIIRDLDSEGAMGSSQHFNLTANLAPNDGTAYLAYDQNTQTCFFRMHVNASVFPAGIMENGFWIVQIADSQAVPAYKGAVLVTGANNNHMVSVIVGTTSSSTDSVYTYRQAQWPNAIRSVTVTGTSTTFFLDFQIPMSVFTTRLGITASSNIRYYYGTSQAQGSTGTINKDYMLGNATAVEFTAVSAGNMTSVGSGTLPVELTTFSAYIKQGTSRLQWETATELNNYGFEVQRSVSQDEWKLIDFVPGHGTTLSPRNYAYEDRLPNGIGGVLKYRLRQIDRDGSSNYSPVVLLRIGGPSTFGITEALPNPFNPTTTLMLSLPVESTVTLRLHDVTGRIVSTVLDNAELGAGSHAIVINANELPGGRYFAVMNSGVRSSTYPLVLSK